MNADFSIDSVVYISHDNKGVTLNMSDGTSFSDNITYYHVIRMLGEKFVRVNKNTIVNLEYVVRMLEDTVFMVNDYKFNIDSEYSKNATNAFYKMKLENFLPN